MDDALLARAGEAESFRGTLYYPAIGMYTDRALAKKLPWSALPTRTPPAGTGDASPGDSALRHILEAARFPARGVRMAAFSRLESRAASSQRISLRVPPAKHPVPSTAQMTR